MPCAGAPLRDRPGAAPRRRSLYGRRRFAALIGVLALALAGTLTERVQGLFTDAPGVPANTMATGTLQPPTTLVATANDLDSLDLSWTPSVSSFAAGYNLHRSLSPGTGYIPAATVPGQASSSHTDNGLQPGNTYYYVAESYVGGWTSAFSNEDSATTAGLPDAALSGSWGTGLSHTAPAGSDRGLVFVAGNEQTIQVFDIGTWGTGLTHAAESGRKRLLVFIAGHEHGTAPAPTLTSVTYGGQTMTKVNGVSAGTSITARVEIWILDEAGIAAATDGTFVPTWSSAPDLPMYSHSFFGGVDQDSPTGAQATGSSDAATPNPITTSALTTVSGSDMVVTGAVAGNDGSYTPQNAFTLGNDQTASTTVTMGTAFKYAGASSETPSMSHSGPNRQAIAGVVLKASSAASLSSVSYGGQALTPVNAVTVGSSTLATAEIWFLDEAGIAAASGSAFVPNWNATPDLPMYSHAFFSGIDQSDPIGDTATASTAAATPNPITTAALTTTAGDIVVTGAVAGNDGSYTPQNAFTLGNNQTASTTVTLGTAHKGPVAAGTETPSMSHSGPNRQVIAGAVLNRREAILANGWTTGLTHTAGAGNDRMLVLIAGMENGKDPGTPPEGDRDLTSVTWGGQAMTEAADVRICTGGAPSSFCARVELWYLLEAGIAAATGNTFVPTWAGDPPFELEEHYAAVTLDRVHQTAPIGNVSTNSSTSDPIQPTNAIGVGRGDIVIVAAVAGQDDSYTPPGTYTEGIDQAQLSSTIATATLAVTADGTEQPSMDYDAVVNRQVILAATIKTNGTP